MSNPLIALAELVTSTRYEHLPPRAVAAAKTFILDTIGVGVAGSTGPNVHELLDTLSGWGERPEATVWTDGRKLPAVQAAIANAYQIHALEWDCVHEPAVLHPMSSLLAALMAHAERRSAQGHPISGRDLLLAAVLGVEIAATIGAASKSVMRFFRPATCGGFGVVAGVGSMERLKMPALMNAFGILYGQTSGTMQAHIEGSPMLGLQVGFNSRAGLCAVDLAAAGLTGPQDVLSGTYGFYKLFEPEFDLEPGWSDLGKTWQITRLSHKPFPSGRLTHAAIDAVQRARRERAFTADGLESMSCAVPPLAYRLVGRPDILAPSPNYARLCIPFVVATTLIDGTVGPEAFAPERLVDPGVHALAARISVTEDANPDVNAMWPQRFAIKLKDGWTWERSIDKAIGHPDHPLSREEHLDKFQHCWALTSRTDAERVIEMVDGLEELRDVSELAAELVAR